MLFWLTHIGMDVKKSFLMVRGPSRKISQTQRLLALNLALEKWEENCLPHGAISKSQLSRTEAGPSSHPGICFLTLVAED